LTSHRLVRKHPRLIAGVCAGIADYLGWSVVAVRILYVAASILSAGFPGTIVYIVLWVVMPDEK
jgi:phage shock protein C